MLKDLRLVAVGAGLIIAGASIASTAIGSDGAPNPTPVLDAAMISEVDPVVAASFPVFDAAEAEPGDVIPAEVASAIASPHRHGRNAKLAKGVRTVNGPGWLVPGRNTVCLVVPDPLDGHGSSCVSASYAATYGVIVGMISPDDPSNVRISFVLPRGAAARVEDSETRIQNALSVDDEGAGSAIASTGSAIKITSADGASTSLELPRGVPSIAQPQQDSREEQHPSRTG